RLPIKIVTHLDRAITRVNDQNLENERHKLRSPQLSPPREQGGQAPTIPVLQVHLADPRITARAIHARLQREIAIDPPAHLADPKLLAEHLRQPREAPAPAQELAPGSESQRWNRCTSAHPRLSQTCRHPSAPARSADQPGRPQLQLSASLSRFAFPAPRPIVLQ